MNNTPTSPYLSALLSTHYSPYETRGLFRDKNSTLFCQIKSRQYSHSRHDTVAFNKKTFELSFHRSHDFWSHDLLGHYRSIRSIQLSPDERLLASAGEDGRLLVWDLQEAVQTANSGQKCPGAGFVELADVKPREFCSVAFGSGGTQVAASGSDCLLLSDLESRRVLSNYTGEVSAREVAAHPSCEALYASASDRGQVYIWDRRVAGYCALEVATSPHAFRGVQFHPAQPWYLSTANAYSGAALYDVRRPNESCIEYKLGTLARRREHVTSAAFNSSGTQVLVQIREHDPLLFNAATGEPICRFFHLDMKNRVTRHEQKGCFLGMEDEYVAVGSEDFRIYVWKVPQHSNSLSPACPNEILDLCHLPHLMLPGHRSIVSKLQFSRKNQLLFSAGVEKMVKVWSPWKFSNIQAVKHRSHGHESRSHFTRWQYIELLMVNGRLSPRLIPSNPPEPTMEEDPVMLAFYDVLIDEFSNNSMFFTFPSEDLDDMETSSSGQILDSILASISDSETDTEFTTDVYTQSTTDETDETDEMLSTSDLTEVDENYYYNSDDF